jgi:hypothetical protein
MMSSNIPKQLSHFTSVEAALSILQNLRFNPSKVTNCSDVFEIDHSPFFIDLSREKHFDWFSRQLLSFYESGHPAFANFDGVKILSSLSIADRLARVKKAVSKGLEKDKLYTMENFNNQLEQQRKNLHVYCFSNCHPSDAVGAWANHAKRHAGVALIFQFPRHEYETRLHPVKYNGKNIRGALFTAREAIGMFTHLDDLDFRFKLFQKILLTKHTDLSWEKEWRVISLLLDGGSDPHLKIKDGLISAIYLGLHISDENKNAIINAVKTYMPSIKIFLAVKRDRRFLKINFNEL